MTKLAPVPTGGHALSPTKRRDLGCLHRYRALHIRHETQREVLPLLMGGLVHDVAARYCKLLRDEELESDPVELRGFMEDVWLERPGTVPADAYGEFVELCTPLQIRLFDPKVIADVEVRLAFDEEWNEVPDDIAFCPDVPEGNEYKVAGSWRTVRELRESVAYGGIIDLVCVVGRGRDAVLDITDWTCGGLGAEVEIHKSLQLREYALLASKKWGIKRVRIRVDSLRTGVSKTVELTGKDHDQTQYRLELERRRLQERPVDDDSAWPASPGVLCEYCGIDCPLEADAEAAGLPIRVQTPERAVEVMKRAVLVDRLNKTLKKLLKQYVLVAGPVEGNGMVAEQRVVDKLTWNMETVIQQLQLAGVDLNAALSIDKPALKRQCRSLHNLQLYDGVIDGLVIERRQNERFGIFKESVKQEQIEHHVIDPNPPQDPEGEVEF